VPSVISAADFFAVLGMGISFMNDGKDLGA
jgi:hypothetical protein